MSKLFSIECSFFYLVKFIYNMLEGRIVWFSLEIVICLILFSDFWLLLFIELALVSMVYLVPMIILHKVCITKLLHFEWCLFLCLEFCLVLNMSLNMFLVTFWHICQLFQLLIIYQLIRPGYNILVSLSSCNKIVSMFTSWLLTVSACLTISWIFS